MTTEQQERQNLTVLLVLMLAAAGLCLLTLNIYPQVDWFFVLAAFLGFVALCVAGAVIAALVWNWKHRNDKGEI